jgi:hypothetical protein
VQCQATRDRCIWQAEVAGHLEAAWWVSAGVTRLPPQASLAGGLATYTGAADEVNGNAVPLLVRQPFRQVLGHMKPLRKAWKQAASHDDESRLLVLHDHAACLGWQSVTAPHLAWLAAVGRWALPSVAGVSAESVLSMGEMARRARKATRPRPVAAGPLPQLAIDWAAPESAAHASRQVSPSMVRLREAP